MINRLVSYDHKAVIQWQSIEALEAGDHAVIAYLKCGVRLHVAQYDSLELNKYAIELLLSEIDSYDKPEFIFPHKDDIKRQFSGNIQHRQQVRTKRNGHGGS